MQTAAIIAIGSLVLVANMTFAWLLVRKTNNGGLVDIVWTFALGATGLLFCFMISKNAPHARALLAAMLTLLWTARLGMPLWRRNVGGKEDPRYTALREQWGARFWPRLFGLLMIQAAAALLLDVTIMMAADNSLPLGFMDLLGLLIMSFALWGGHRADAQLAAFKKDPTKRGQICDAGLWGRSRHPNYFFEVLFWSGWPLLALSDGWLPGLVAVIGPLLMYWLLRHVSGEPLVEAHMARHYGDTFHDYCRRVPAFFPRLF